MQSVAGTLHTASEHDVSSITTADGAHLGCQQSTELMPPRQFKWTRLFRRKTKCGFCACAITFQLASVKIYYNGVNVDFPLCVSAVAFFTPMRIIYVAILLLAVAVPVVVFFVFLDIAEFKYELWTCNVRNEYR